MKVAVVSDRPHSTYGAELNLLGLAEIAIDLGHEVVATSIQPGPFLDRAAAAGFETVVVPSPAGLAGLTDGGVRPTPATAWRLARFGRELHATLAGCDVVVASSARLAAMLWPGRVRRPQLLWYVQMLAPPGLFTTVAGLTAARVAVIAPGVEATLPRPLRWMRRSRTLPPWRDMQAFTPAAERVAEGPLTVVTVGKVTPRKGIDLLVEAAGAARSRNADVRILVVGDPSGPNDEAFRDAVEDRARLDGTPVEWAGWHDDVVPLLHRADAFALVSEREGLPGAALEAMAAGLPVLVTDTGPIADVVRANGCGLVAAQGDHDAVAQHLVTLVREPELRRRMGRAGMAAASAYTREATMVAIGAILESMAPPQSRRRGTRP